MASPSNSNETKTVVTSELCCRSVYPIGLRHYPIYQGNKMSDPDKTAANFLNYRGSEYARESKPYATNA